VAYLLPGASFALAPGVSLAGNSLFDVDGRSYSLTAVGTQICALAARPVEVNTVCLGLSEYFDVDVVELTDHVRHFVLDLHGRGLIAIQQSFASEAFAGLVNSILPAQSRDLRAMVDVGRVRMFRRYDPNLWGVLRSVVEAYQSIAWGGVLISMGAIAIAVAASPNTLVLFDGVRALAIAAPLLVLIFLASIFVHELAHLMALRLTRSVTYSTYVASGIAGLSYTQPRGYKRAFIAAAGPVCSMIFLVSLAAGIVWTPASFWAATTFDQFRLSGTFAILSFAVWQLLAFTPITTDGRTFIRAIRRK
jgi:hypothetical protein